MKIKIADHTGPWTPEGGATVSPMEERVQFTLPPDAAVSVDVPDLERPEILTSIGLNIAAAAQDPELEKGMHLELYDDVGGLLDAWELPGPSRGVLVMESFPLPSDKAAKIRMIAIRNTTADTRTYNIYGNIYQFYDNFSGDIPEAIKESLDALEREPIEVGGGPVTTTAGDATIQFQSNRYLVRDASIIVGLESRRVTDIKPDGKVTLDADLSAPYSGPVYLDCPILIYRGDGKQSIPSVAIHEVIARTSDEHDSDGRNYAANADGTKYEIRADARDYEVFISAPFASQDAQSMIDKMLSSGISVDVNGQQAFVEFQEGEPAEIDNIKSRTWTLKRPMMLVEGKGTWKMIPAAITTVTANPAA